MKSLISVLAISAALAGAAIAQPSGGPDAKGNAPLKPAHTVNDGAPKPGRNSFTEGQARTHIEKAGFTGVSNLMKGDDGVWRGHALRDGAPTDVAMDFKGNVSTPVAGGPPPMAPASAGAMGPAREPAPAPVTEHSDATSTTTRTTEHAMHARHHAHHRRHHHGRKCAHPSANGAACSGVDRNGNGISDREDRAIHNGARP